MQAQVKCLSNHAVFTKTQAENVKQSYKSQHGGLSLLSRALSYMQGSDAELEEETVTAHRSRCVLLAQQHRRAFHQTTNLSDKDSSELWNSSHMECRPFKDPTYDLRRMEQDIGIQAVPVTQDLAIQATPARVSLPARNTICR